MTNIKTWMKGIETLEPPADLREPRAPFGSVEPRHPKRPVGTIVVAVGVAVAAVAFAIVTLVPRTEPNHVASQPPGQLVRVAARTAAANGDPTPALALWGRVSVEEADTLIGREPSSDDRDEYVVVMDGDFVCGSCAGARADGVPRGATIVMTFDASTLHVLGSGVELPLPNVSNLNLRPMPAMGSRTVGARDTPWRLPAPTGWTSTTLHTPADPDLKTGVLQTWITDADYRFDESSPGPNGTPGASDALGADGVAVRISLLWSPPDAEPIWEASGGTTIIREPTAWHDDVQNRGWRFRERMACRGDACVRILEWRGPGASAASVAAAAHVAESADLAATWSDKLVERSPRSEITQTYDDALGWSVDVPAGWYIRRIDGSNGRFSLEGAAFSNEPITMGPPSAGPLPDQSHLATDGVMLIVTHRVGGPAPTIADDSSFPLDAGDAQHLPGPAALSSVLDFRGDGLEFTAQFGGDADGDPRKFDALVEAIGTIRFQPWELGDVRNGFEWVDADFPAGRGRPALVRRLGIVYVMRIGGATYVLDVPDLSCEGQDQGWDPGTDQILLRGPCYAPIRYNADGSPDPANAPEYQQKLDRHPVIRAHDGSWLVALNVVVGD